MFFDTNTSQSNNQVTNLANTINFGDSGDSQFSPKNEQRADFKNSNDLGVSAGVALGPNSSAMGGPVAMKRAEEGNGPLQGLMPTKSNTNIFLYIALAVTVLTSLFFAFKRKKR